jgi:hypothetical protein
MKKLKNEIRMYIAEMLLSWAANIAPTDDKQGRDILCMVVAYFDKCVKQNSLKTK